MLTGSEDSPATSQMWSWKKILASLLGILTVFIIALLAYDEKLEPHHDLKPTRTQVPDSRTNGYLMLQAAWENLPTTDYKLYRKWSDIREGLLPWDDGLIPLLNPARRDLRKDLSLALAAPAWQVPLPETTALSEDMRSEDMLYDASTACLAMEAEAWQKLRNGYPTAVVGLIKDLRHLSLRQISGSNRGADLAVGFYCDEVAASLTCRLITEVPQQETELLQLAGLWEEDQLNPADLADPVSGESLFLAACVRSGKHHEDHYGEASRGNNLAIKLLTKPNAVVNRMNRCLSVIKMRGMAISPSFEYSVFEEVGPLFLFRRNGLAKLDPNIAGLQIARQLVAPSVHTFCMMPRQHLFRARALRIAIAVKRWQLKHPGSTLAALDELVPEYLNAIPSDPWNGQPFRWAAAEQIIYAVGSDWMLNMPTFHRNRGPWFGSDDDNPGLRMVVPPPPPPASLPAKTTKPAKASSTLPRTP